MKKSKIKLISAPILILTFALLFSKVTYARPLTDIFRGGLIQINNFFVQEQFRAYATAIDFFFFSLLFIAIYMMGARYAFKEIKRPEQVIVILLGLMTAFLLVIGGFSATILLPYIHWLLYLLLFILLWRLLKGIKNPFWRFLLALLLTLLIVGFFAWLFNLITTPEIGGVSTPSLGIGDFFKSFGDSFKGVDFGGYVPGIPTYVRDALQLPSVPAPTPTPTGPETLPIVPTPATTPPKEKGWLPGGYSGWHLAWIIPLLIAIILGGRRLWPKRKLKPGPQPPLQPGPIVPPTITEEKSVQDIINKITEIISRKSDSKEKIIDILDEKYKLLIGEGKLGYLKRLIDLEEKDVANLFLDESRELIDKEEGIVKSIIEKEREFLQQLKKLYAIEDDFNKRLNKWITLILQSNINNKEIAKQNIENLKILLTQNVKEIAEDSQKGILWLIAYCYNLEKKEIILAKDLADLLEENHIKDLVKGRFKEVITDDKKLKIYYQKEKELIVLLSLRLKKQIEILENLKKLLSETPQQPSPYTPYIPYPYGPGYGAPYYRAPYYGVEQNATSRASQTLKTSPNATLNHYDEIENYFKSLPSSYMEQVMNLASQIRQPMANSVRSVICIPVAGHQEGNYIYESLKNYTYQTANTKIYEIFLFVNNPDKDTEGNNIAPDNTLDEIKRFVRDYPHIPIRMIQAVIPRSLAKIGMIRKILADTVLLRHHNRGRNAPDLIIVSNDADNKGVAPEYIDNFIRKFDSNSNLDALAGQIEWGPESYIKYPLIYVGTRLFQYMIILDRRKRNYLFSSGANFAFKSSIYAAIGGYNGDIELGEDTTLGEDIVNARHTRATIGFAGVRVSRIYTSSRRAIYALQKGIPPAAQWDKIGFNEYDYEVRKLIMEQDLEIDYNNQQTLQILIKGLEWVINATAQHWQNWLFSNAEALNNFKKALSWIGIEVEFADGKFKVNNMNRLIKKLKEYQSSGLFTRDLKSGKVKRKITPTLSEPQIRQISPETGKFFRILYKALLAKKFDTANKTLKIGKSKNILNDVQFKTLNEILKDIIHKKFNEAEERLTMTEPGVFEENLIKELLDIINDLKLDYEPDKINSTTVNKVGYTSPASPPYQPYSIEGINVKIIRPVPDSTFKIGSYIDNLEAIVLGPDGKVISNNNMKFEWILGGYTVNGNIRYFNLHRGRAGPHTLENSKPIYESLALGNAKLKVRLCALKREANTVEPIFVAEDEIDIKLTSK